MSLTIHTKKQSNTDIHSAHKVSGLLDFALCLPISGSSENLRQPSRRLYPHSHITLWKFPICILGENSHAVGKFVRGTFYR